MEKNYKNNRKRRRRLSQKRKLSDRQTKPIAGDVLKYFQQPEPHSDYVFVPYPRVSYPDQLERYSLEQQFWTIKKYALEHHLKLYEIDYRIQCSSLYRGASRELAQEGFEKSPSSHPNPKLYKPHFDCLREIVQHLWVKMRENPSVKYALLFTSVDRAVRSDDFSFENKDAKLTEEELETYLEVTRPFYGLEPIPSFVICHPLMKADEIQSWRNTYGVVIESEQPRKPGDLKREKDEKHDESIELQLEGKSHRYISEQLDVPIERIRSWWLKCSQYYPKH